MKALLPTSGIGRLCYARPWPSQLQPLHFRSAAASSTNDHWKFTGKAFGFVMVMVSCLLVSFKTLGQTEAAHKGINRVQLLTGLKKSSAD